MLLKEPAAEANSKPLPHSVSSSESLGALLDHHAAFLGFVQRRVPDRALAEDILQSAYVRALQRADSVRDRSAVVPWFYSILRNAIIDNARSRQSENGALERWAAELEENQASADFSHEITHGIVCGCIEKLLPTLKESYAEVLREVDLGGRPLAEFASRHKLTPGNAAVRSHRARAALKQELIRTCGVCSYHACLDCSCKTPKNSIDSLK
jgi:RNA polymerase sigma-70 factor (ECF subfamily)